MPMYFPDLASVQSVARLMAEHKGDKKYTGIYPITEKELPEARRQLGRYFRTVWDDSIQAIEVERAVTKENYGKVMQAEIMKRAGLLYDD